VVLLLASAGLAGAAPPPVLQPGVVPWSHLELVATRFPFSVTSTVDLTFQQPADVALRETAEGRAVAPGDTIALVSYRADLFGQKFRTSLWLRPDTGAALQYETAEAGHRKRNRVLRFTDSGVALWTVRPAAGEEGKPQSAWTDRSTGFRPYEPATREPVLDPLGLLYVVAAADLSAGRQEFAGLAGRQVVRLALVPKPPKVVAVDYLAQQGTGERRCKGKVRALPVEIQPESLNGEEADLDFLGLSSDIEVLVEEKTRLPILITGRARKFGSVTIRLRSAVIREGTACG
jgi:hypothetical protein